jgi:predicted RecA/RadA family phage recombinase
MAKNEKERRATQMRITVTAGAKSGDPVVYGQRPGVCLTDADANNKATVAFEGGYDLSVKGIDGGGNSAVAEGDILYFVTGDTPHISKKATGVRYGYAAGAVNAGATATITVILGY